ncbi:hypothetical protein [Deinococcus yavapaiensis]|uniref:hypothetical protein n=1 Tax=Deinococcus yavapaiensis TaxID=309889 RepID=UPI000DA19478|nr:hypothetical protein [Deinococcus yavapaiensis]
MKTLGPYVVTRALREGVVTTLSGVDRLTGLEAVLFLVRGDVLLPNLQHPMLLGYSDLGLWSDGMYAVSTLPPGSRPAVHPASVAVGVLEALAWLHARNLVHGGLTREQVWEVSGGVVVSGAALPWGALDGGYDAPEGGKSAAADLFALGRILEDLGEVPSGLSRLLASDPVTRGTALEALALQRSPALAMTVVLSPSDFPDKPAVTVPTEPAPTETARIEDRFEDDVPSMAESVEPASNVVVVTPSKPPSRDTPERPRIPYGWNDVKGSASAAPTKVDAPPAAPPPVDSPRSRAIRIGWEEDHSWRVVKEGAPPPAAQGRPPAWFLPAVIGGLALVVLALFLSLRSTSTACCTVLFTVDGDAKSAVVKVMRAPDGSGLEVGQRLGVIPGAIRFPNKSGAYRVRVTAPGYAAGELELRLPRDTRALVELKR